MGWQAGLVSLLTDSQARFALPAPPAAEAQPTQPRSSQQQSHSQDGSQLRADPEQPPVATPAVQAATSVSLHEHPIRGQQASQASAQAGTSTQPLQAAASTPQLPGRGAAAENELSMPSSASHAPTQLQPASVPADADASAPEPMQTRQQAEQDGSRAQASAPQPHASAAVGAAGQQAAEVPSDRGLAHASAEPSTSSTAEEVPQAQRQAGSNSLRSGVAATSSVADASSGTQLPGVQQRESQAADAPAAQQAADAGPAVDGADSAAAAVPDADTPAGQALSEAPAAKPGMPGWQPESCMQLSHCIRHSAHGEPSHAHSA